MSNYKKIRASDRTFYPKKQTLRTVILNAASNDIDTPAVAIPITYRTLIAGEDLTGWIYNPIMIAADGKAYKAEAIESNYNRVIGILTVENTSGNAVKIQCDGDLITDEYDWSSEDTGTILVVRDTGISSDMLIEKDGTEVMHIHIANVLTDNSIEILSESKYILYL